MPRIIGLARGKSSAAPQNRRLAHIFRSESRGRGKRMGFRNASRRSGAVLVSVCVAFSSLTVRAHANPDPIRRSSLSAPRATLVDPSGPNSGPVVEIRVADQQATAGWASGTFTANLNAIRMDLHVLRNKHVGLVLTNGTDKTISLSGRDILIATTTGVYRPVYIGDSGPFATLQIGPRSRVVHSIGGFCVVGSECERSPASQTPWTQIPGNIIGVKILKKPLAFAGHSYGT
jgi:hypothetical protein